MSYEIDNYDRPQKITRKHIISEESKQYKDRVEKRRKELGILYSFTDGNSELEKLENEAMDYIYQDKEVPKELKEQILALRNKEKEKSKK